MELQTELEGVLKYRGPLFLHPIFKDIRPHIVNKFWRYHAANPHVYPLFEKYALELVGSGRKRYGTKAIQERIRWHLNVETTGTEFKMSNDFTSCYARLLIINHPTLDLFFSRKSSI